MTDTPNASSDDKQFAGRAIASAKTAKEALEFFERNGIEPEDIRNKEVRLNIGKSIVSGKCKAVSSRFGMLKVYGHDGFIHFIRMSKVSDLAVKFEDSE